MSMQHSPKGSEKKSHIESLTSSVLAQSSSTPDLTVATGSYVTTRAPKRKQTDDCDYFMSKMETVFAAFTAESNKKYQALLESVNVIREQNNQISTSIAFISAKYDEMQTKFDKLENDRKFDRSIIQALEQKIEQLEKNSRICCVELRNIPVKKDEKTDDLINVTKTLGDSLKVPISHSDIKNIYRGYSKPDTNKPIIIEFGSTIIKEKLIASYKAFQKEKEKDEKFSLAHMKIEGPPAKVYLSDYLTPKMKKLHFMARDYATSNGYRYCWATTGAIYLRKQEGLQAIRLKNEEDLKNLHHPN